MSLWISPNRAPLPLAQMSNTFGRLNPLEGPLKFAVFKKIGWKTANLYAKDLEIIPPPRPLSIDKGQMILWLVSMKILWWYKCNTGKNIFGLKNEWDSLSHTHNTLSHILSEHYRVFQDLNHFRIQVDELLVWRPPSLQIKKLAQKRVNSIALFSWLVAPC